MGFRSDPDVYVKNLEFGLDLANDFCVVVTMTTVASPNRPKGRPSRRRQPFVDALRGYLLIPALLFTTTLSVLLFHIGSLPNSDLFSLSSAPHSVVSPSSAAFRRSWSISKSLPLGGFQEDDGLVPPTLPSDDCGMDWKDYIQKFLVQKGVKDKFSLEQPLLWTVSGGDTYRSYLEVFLAKWKSVGMAPVVVVSLDDETAPFVCGLGYAAMKWSEPKASYSVVADAKFRIASVLAREGVHQIFVEPDIFCNHNPLGLFRKPLLDRPDTHMVYIGHGDISWKPNIGFYQIRPTKIMADFFDSLTKVLRYSINETKYVTVNGLTKLFFDQEVFYFCLPKTNLNDPTSDGTERAMFAVNDTSRTFDMLELCRHGESFYHDFVSHVYINAHSPPTRFDTTICVHPLFDTAFASLHHKLATAKFQGFDPNPMPSRLLKTATGDMTFNECWSYIFLEKNIVTKLGHGRFERHVAQLVILAQQTNRTLVLPRYIRDKNAFAVPFMSYVDIQSLNSLVSWRFLTPEERLLQPSSVVVKADNSLQETIHKLSSPLVADTALIELESACSLVEEADKDPTPEVRAIAKRIKLCFSDPRVSFARSIGSWSRLCGT